MDNLFVNFDEQSRRLLRRGITGAALKWVGGRILDNIDSKALVHRTKRRLNRELRNSDTGTLSLDELRKNEGLSDISRFITDDRRLSNGKQLSSYTIHKEDINKVAKDIAKRRINEKRYGYQDPNKYEKRYARLKGAYNLYGKIRDAIDQSNLYNAYRGGDRRAGVQLATRKLSEAAEPYLKERNRYKEAVNLHNNNMNELDYRKKLLEQHRRERNAGASWVTDEHGNSGYVYR